ncbi:MAG: transcription antitermination factor NusB [Magnetococcales bacterium]|nr:transcription antitermination factor NusB [Magnetococcales bacterium]
MALQALYLSEMNGCEVGDAATQMENGLADDSGPADLEFFRALTRGIASQREDLDERLKRVLDNWSLGQMAVIDRNILRIGLYEMMQEDSTPLRVLISEAIELAKRFGGEDSGRFVNGILDRLGKELRSLEARSPGPRRED